MSDIEKAITDLRWSCFILCMATIGFSVFSTYTDTRLADRIETLEAAIADTTTDEEGR